MRTSTEITSQSVIVEQGTDVFFKAQVAMLRAAGHVAECSPFNAFGNRHSAFWFVPVAGEKPRRVFPEQNRHANVWRLEVRHYGNRLLMAVDNDFQNETMPSEWLDTADYSAEVLERWFADFTALSKRQHAARRAQRQP